MAKLVKLGTDGNYTKNALHLAAWKGDPESIELLIDAGNKYGLDLVNVISTGEGNSILGVNVWFWIMLRLSVLASLMKIAGKALGSSGS